MRHYCCVSGCGAHISDGRLFGFPKAVERAERWKAFCQDPDLDGYHLRDLHKSFQVCIKHFPEEAFTYPSSGKLLRCAVPTLYPPQESPTLYPAEESPTMYPQEERPSPKVTRIGDIDDLTPYVLRLSPVTDGCSSNVGYYRIL
ncbi:uncharacterized protein LOC124163557 isoform X2 [Ischnura elegans]|uniref:uncharacterized protein LOC124163557 isoform X2 n=1 Tax=Ischnura elegans TaxID=197161 RepID=UPI001ED8761E|nr:uncharacterized protein LOC124163557 isoform X2 [Ischnura elegans]